MRTVIAKYVGLLAAGLVISPVWSQMPPAAHVARPGSVNYVEGQASMNGGPLGANAIGTTEVERGQSLTTQAGRVEILLTPGVFLRLADNSSLKMISPELTNTEVQLDKGRAVVEVVEIHHENNIRIDQNGASTRLLKTGLYEFDADQSQVRVFKGSAEVSAGGRKVKLGGDKTTTIGPTMKDEHFDARQYQDDFYRWAGLRSGYLSEASVDAAQTYMGAGPGWAGFGWYWDPLFSGYTYLPGDGIFYSPFGWGFYSPFAIYGSPFMYYRGGPHGFGEYHYPYGHGFGAPGGIRGGGGFRGGFRGGAGGNRGGGGTRGR